MISSSRRLVTGILCLILFPVVVSAQESSGENMMGQVHQVFKMIPIEGKLTEVSRELHAQLEQNPFGLQPEANEQMLKLFSRSFATESLKSDAWSAFQRTLNPTQADSILQGIRSGDVNKALETEQEFYTIQGIRKRVVNNYELEQNPPSQQRTDLVQSIAEAKSAAESEVESQALIFRAVVTAFSELSDQQSFTEAQIDGFVTNYRNQVQAQIGQDLNNQLLLMFHGLDNDVLKETITFYESRPGQRLSDTVSESMHSAYRAAADRFLDSVRNL